MQWASSIGVNALVTLLDPRGNSEAGATEQRDQVGPEFSQSAAPLLQAAVILEVAASAKQQSSPAEPQCCSRVNVLRGRRAGRAAAQ